VSGPVTRGARNRAASADLGTHNPVIGTLGARLRNSRRAVRGDACALEVAAPTVHSGSPAASHYLQPKAVLKGAALVVTDV
jgi:hypothetical protein